MFSLEVSIRSGDVTLPGEVTVPAGAHGLILFAHGCGSSRYSPRNHHVAEVLHDAGLGTLLFDLLTLEEERAERMSAHLRFDIELLAQRLHDATLALRNERATRDLPLGYFGADTGGAAALTAAALRPDLISAVVLRGGRPDLTAPAVLSAVQAPTLLIVGEADRAVLNVNRRAVPHLRAPVELRTITGASRLFEEPGALDRVANLARDWFQLHLSRRRPVSTRTRMLRSLPEHRRAR